MMDTKAAVTGQYHAALAMLKQAIDQCPDDLWTAGGHPCAFWRIAYHALFFSHLYVQPNEEAFQPWAQHRDQHQYLGPLPWPPHDEPRIGEPYSKEDVLAYWELCDGMIDAGVDALDLDSPECGFGWYDMPKLDHQMMSIRHIQHHAAQLADRLRTAADAGVDWVGGVRAKAGGH